MAVRRCRKHHGGQQTGKPEIGASLTTDQRCIGQLEQKHRLRNRHHLRSYRNRLAIFGHGAWPVFAQSGRTGHGPSVPVELVCEAVQLVIDHGPSSASSRIGIPQRS